MMGNNFLTKISFRFFLYYLWRYLGKCVFQKHTLEEPWPLTNQLQTSQIIFPTSLMKSCPCVIKSFRTHSVHLTEQMVFCIFSITCLLSVSENHQPLSQPSTDSDSANSSPIPPAILITAPSQEDFHASKTTMTIADAIKERRPSSTPIVVGRKLVTRKWLGMSRRTRWTENQRWRNIRS